MRRVVTTTVAVVLTAVVTPVVSAAVVLGASIFLPLPAELPDPRPGIESRITHVYDVHGVEIATFREFETSKPVDPAQIPQVLRDAVVAAEDKNFYSHGGIDVRGTLRALWTDLRSQAVVQGGSTITQQYVKNAYTGGERTIARKVREAILASQLDRQMSKDEILFRYLSTIYFGEGAYGVGAAAETYFRKEVQHLTLSEAALLAGVVPAPSRYSPRVDPAAAEAKRVHVLNEMLSEGYITPEAHAAAAAEVVYLDIVVAPPPGPATIVWPPLPQQTSAPWFTDYLARWLEARLPGGHDQLYRGGLHIYTTFDPAAQAAAEDAMHRAMDRADPDLQMAIAAVEPPTGYVRAIVGGRDFNVSQVNNALGADGGGTGRQPGSAFKPFVLAAAFEQGVSPAKQYSGGVLQVGDDVIENYGGARYGTLDLRTAMWESVNTVYARLILDVGVERTMEMAGRLGLSMPAYDPAVYGASVALGAVEASPLGMASAFGVFANGGRRAEPTPVLEVRGPGDEGIVDRTRAVDEAQQVIPDVVADNVTDVLRGVLQSGTAAGKGLNRPAAGKTGTSSDNADAWFVGFTPTLSTAVWVGHESGRIELRNVLGVRGGMTGGAVPATTWQRFMRSALADVPVTDFNEPAPIRDIADQAKRDARGGFDPGRRRSAQGTPNGGPFVYGLEAPVVAAPTTTTTTLLPSTTTTRPPPTSTTRPPIIN